MLNQIIWYLIRCYTYIVMNINNFIKQNKSDICNSISDQNFSIIEKNELKLIYYPLFEKTSYSFIQIILTLNNNSYELKLKPYFVVGNNILKQDFVKWLMKTNYNIEINDTDDYEINIIDNNVNQIFITKNDYIKLNKDNYLKKSHSN